MYYGHRSKLYLSAKFYYSILIISQDWSPVIEKGVSITQTSNSLKVHLKPLFQIRWMLKWNCLCSQESHCSRNKHWDGLRAPHIVKGCWKQEANSKPEILKWYSIKKYLPLLSAVSWTLFIPKALSAGEFCCISEREEVQKSELAQSNVRKRAMSTENYNTVYRRP